MSEMPTAPPPTLVPSLATTGLSTANPNAPPTPHMNSGRRLSKSVLHADSSGASSNAAGIVMLKDSEGTPRAVRVVQKEESEGRNIIRVGWIWSTEGKTYQIELRHGRKSGIRKIYINKELQERQKSLSNRLHDTGRTHDLSIAGKAATIIINKKGGVGGGFMYQLVINGNPIEQNLCGPDMKGPLDIGTRPIALPKRPEGLGMTLRNNPLGSTGVVVWTVEPGKAAEQCGVKVGDVVLSIEDNLINNIGCLITLILFLGLY